MLVVFIICFIVGSVIFGSQLLGEQRRGEGNREEEYDLAVVEAAVLLNAIGFSTAVKQSTKRKK